jgi:hypothetical protein
MERLAWAEGSLPVVNKWSRRWRAVMWTRNKQRRSVALLSVFTLIVITRKELSDS